ncbi:putative quinol monooxygenase [Streptomyces cavernae]|uniref:putative quinol monooxygenase n=1 Tax=Streptomyces cavernae TaxID=2259034 RepID=UPI000FEBB10B|nr:putative quinol monooxygenase [Streptomyces cavernae]
MIIAMGSARALPGRREDLTSAAREMAAATRVEDGCHSYGFFSDIDDENTIVSLETWRDQDALDAHMAHPRTQEFLAHTAQLVEGTPSLTIHRVPDSG